MRYVNFGSTPAGSFEIGSCTRRPNASTVFFGIHLLDRTPREGQNWAGGGPFSPEDVSSCSGHSFSYRHAPAAPLPTTLSSRSGTANNSMFSSAIANAAMQTPTFLDALSSEAVQNTFRFFSDRPLTGNWKSFVKFETLKDLYSAEGALADACRALFAEISIWPDIPYRRWNLNHLFVT